MYWTSTPLNDHQPYLSVVATARNDNHGGDLLGRMQHFVDAFTEQCERFGLSAELIIVEWNPPKNQPRLSDALDWSNPAKDDQCRVRIIEVPESVHSRLKHAEELPLFQMIAKNVGVRRARGKFILATNIDILFCDELVQYLARRSLKYNASYRVDRWDIEPAPSFADSIQDRLAFCKDNVIRRHTKFDSQDFRNDAVYSVAWRPSLRNRLLELLQDTKLIPIVTRPPLHLNGCGDFTLLHRDHWFALGGYAEFEMYSMHIDSVFCTAATMLGLKEVILDDPYRIYHIEHGTGSGFKPEAVDALESRLQRSGISALTMADFQKIALEMRRNGRPTLFNNENWGFADIELNETLLTEAAPDISSALSVA